jgi:membrane protease YdiL (CAAX protease family)
MTTAPAPSRVAPTRTHSTPASRRAPDGLPAAWWPPVVAFLALAYALSWWPWPLAALSSRPDPAVLLPWGPSVAALVLTLRAGRADLRRLLGALVRVRLGRLWWVLALPVAVASVALAVSVLLGAPAPSGSDLLAASVVAVATLPLTLVLAGPLGEELGWRGFLLPRLLQRFGPVAATLVLAGAWILFHLPLIVSRPQQYGPGWALTLVGVALVMTRLHLLSGGSLALAIAFHTVVNTATALVVRSLPEAHRPSAWLVVGGLWLAVGLTVALAGGQVRVPAPQRRGIGSARTRVMIATAALAAVQFVLVLDSAIINVALATVARDLAVPTSELTWVVNAYALTFGGLLLLGGRLADLMGRRRVFVLGTAVFGVASLSGAFAASPGWLITARGLQGVGPLLPRWPCSSTSSRTPPGAPRPSGCSASCPERAGRPGCSSAASSPSRWGGVPSCGSTSLWCWRCSASRPSCRQRHDAAGASGRRSMPRVRSPGRRP